MEIISDNYSDTQIYVKNKYISSSTSSRHDIRGKNNKQIFFQTKKVSFYIHNEKGFVIVFFPKDDALANTLIFAEKRIRKHLNLKNYTWYSAIQETEDTEEYSTIFFKIGKNAHLYNSKKDKLEFDENMRHYGRLLIGMKYVWISELKKLCGLQMEIEQFEIDTEYIFNDYAFIDEALEFGKHPKYSQYFSMLKKGVPQMAVAQKIHMNGDPHQILDYTETDIVPLSFNSSKNLEFDRPKLDITGINDFNINNLKKVDKVPKKRIQGIGMAAAPSLATILKCLNNLKPVVVEDKEDQEAKKNLGYLEQVGVV